MEEEGFLLGGVGKGLRSEASPDAVKMVPSGFRSSLFNGKSWLVRYGGSVVRNEASLAGLSGSI